LPVRASASLSPPLHGQSENVVQLAVGEQSAIGGDHGTAKLKHQAAVEIEPQRHAF